MRNRALRACSAVVVASMAAIAACDTSFTVAPGGDHEGGANGAEAGGSATNDGAVGDASITQGQDGSDTIQTDGAASVDSGSAPSLGNVDCQMLGANKSTLFCADFSGSFPYGFEDATNNANITSTMGTPNGKSSNVFDFGVAAGADAGATITLLKHSFTWPTSASLALDADIRIVSFDVQYGSIAGLLLNGQSVGGDVGVGAQDPAKIGLRAIEGSGLTSVGAGTGWHHVRVAVDTTGTATSSVDTVTLDSVKLGALTGEGELKIGLYNATYGAASGPTELQIDNVVLSTF
jgi:hypothetical protein